ncbi:kinase-like domain-containing protein [Haematococcus lacustris]
MEFADHGCLQDAVERGWLRITQGPGLGQPNMPAILQTAYEIASALSYLHAHDVVHGDLSAWNVLLTSQGTPSAHHRGFTAKVADFGLSRCLEKVMAVQTRTYGTITHQPPETLSHGLVSRETDTYSLGVLMWQMYTGRRPWHGMTHGHIVAAVVAGTKGLEFPPDAPKAFVALAEACMAHEASDRPDMQTICKVLQALRNTHSPTARGR